MAAPLGGVATDRVHRIRGNLKYLGYTQAGRLAIGRRVANHSPSVEFAYSEAFLVASGHEDWRAKVSGTTS